MSRNAFRGVFPNAERDTWDAFQKQTKTKRPKAVDLVSVDPAVALTSATDDGKGIIPYLEEEDGTVCSAVKCTAIRAAAKHFASTLEVLGSVPQTFGRMPHIFADAFCYYLISRFDVVGFGEGLWKAHAIAQDWFPGFVRTLRIAYEKEKDVAQNGAAAKPSKKVAGSRSPSPAAHMSGEDEEFKTLSRPPSPAAHMLGDGLLTFRSRSPNIQPAQYLAPNYRKRSPSMPPIPIEKDDSGNHHTDSGKRARIAADTDRGYTADPSWEDINGEVSVQLVPPSSSPHLRSMLCDTAHSQELGVSAELGSDS